MSDQKHLEFADDLEKQIDLIRAMLISKNMKYGDSALNPIRMFSNSSPIEQIKVRLDDKISRLASGQQDDDEDIEQDMIGYLLLLRIARKRQQECGK